MKSLIFVKLHIGYQYSIFGIFNSIYLYTDTGIVVVAVFAHGVDLFGYFFDVFDYSHLRLLLNLAFLDFDLMLFLFYLMRHD